MRSEHKQSVAASVKSQKHSSNHIFNDAAHASDTVTAKSSTNGGRFSHQFDDDQELDDEERLLQKTIIRNFMERSKQTDILDVNRSNPSKFNDDSDDTSSKVS